MKKISTVLIFYLLFCSSVFAGIKFGNADINSNDEILFTVQQNIPGTYSYQSLFSLSIKNQTASNPDLLTAFPEKMELVLNSNALQIRNRYGIGLYNIENNSFYWKKLSTTIPTNSMRLTPYSVSPNGLWACYVEKTEFASGILYLENIKTGEKKVLDEDAALSYESVPVKWLKDSSLVIYEKNKKVYFCNPQAYLKGIEASEDYRFIGNGTINSINCANDKSIIFIDSDLVYKIGTKELYTLGLYSGIIGKGTTIGRLPTAFNCQIDTFSVDESVSSIFVIQNKKVLTYYKIDSFECNYLEVVYSSPYVDSKSSLLDASVIWSGDNPIIWIRRLPYDGGKLIASVYKITNGITQILDVQDSGIPYVSPDGSKVAFYSGAAVYVYDIKTWKRIASLSGEKSISIVWKDNNSLFVGGDKTIKYWNFVENTTSLVQLSSVVNGIWFDNSKSVVALNANGNSYIYDSILKTWKKTDSVSNRKNLTQNGRYRVFCGATSNHKYENALYFRTLAGKPITIPVFKESVAKLSNPVKVALIFDGYDNSDGLTRILYGLGLYNVKGTFFLNGDFIRRYPKETSMIAASNNECASMFFTSTDLMSNDFIMDEEFIRRGLARNEDEFYKATGKELSLMWHAPNYKVSDEIIDFGAKAGYSYINTTQNVSDTVTFEQAINENKHYYSPSMLITRYMECLKSKAGGVIPVTIGVSKGTCDGYVYDYLDILISAILDAGYEIVPARDFIQ
ncbi:MAG: polysaccharide deacetylase family protein [Treponema sp.]|nr:polysaccharide deacetylase family protein [Treponema sp.]